VHVTDPYGHGYHYDAEQITILSPLTNTQRATCHEMVGLPLPPRTTSIRELTLVPGDAEQAERLRRYLRVEKLRHYATLTVSHEPDAAPPGELIELFAYARRSKALDAALQEAARTLLCIPPESLYEGPRAAIETLYRRLGAADTRARIEAAERRTHDSPH
jgi:hypothetical protein